MDLKISILSTTLNRKRLNPVQKGEYSNITELVSKENGKKCCPYCEGIYESLGGLYQHIRFKHGLSSKELYDSLCKRDNDGICIICGKQTEFKAGKYLLTCSANCKDKWFSIDELRAQKISLKRRKYNTESFIKKAESIHGDRFDYTKTEIGLLHDRIDIICKKHGLFTTVACYHLDNLCGGCKKCASESMVISKAKWTEERKEEVKSIRKKTNFKRYGNTIGPSPFGSEEYKKIIRDKYGVDNPFSSKQIQEKIKKTNISKYGVTNPAYLEKTIIASHSEKAIRKRYLTHKKNNSFTSSKPEDDFNAFLVSVFGESDVYRNYRDDPRYPFACDFYIKSQDLFIELNLYFTHGFHWFDSNNPDDLKKLEIWKSRSKGKDLYSVGIYVWTVSDPQKREIAKKNKLNYVVLWNLEEIERYKNELTKRFVLK